MLLFPKISDDNRRSGNAAGCFPIREPDHRDLKPDNLMLVADPIAPGGERVKILDFGIAKLPRPVDKPSEDETDNKLVLGTPTYMSPEQCKGAGGVDAKTDVYSLGCVLYEVLAGHPPFVAESQAQILGMQVFKQPPPLASQAPKIPPAVEELVHLLLTKDKEQRPSMSEAADGLGRLLSKLSGAGPVIRSRVPGSTDPNAARTFLPQYLTTMIGQWIHPSDIRHSQQRKWLIVCGAGILLLTVGVNLWLRSAKEGAAGKTTAPQQSVGTPPAAAPPQRMVRWLIQTVPSGATVLDAEDHTLGVTPWINERPSESGTTTLRIRRSGYIEETVTLDRGTNFSDKFTLTRSAPAAPRRESPRPPAAATETAKSARRQTPSSPKRIGYED